MLFNYQCNFFREVSPFDSQLKEYKASQQLAMDYEHEASLELPVIIDIEIHNGIKSF